MLKSKYLSILVKSFGLGLLFLIMLVAVHQIVHRRAQVDTFSNLESLPKNKVGLVLGTSKYVGGGQVNLYYKYRLEAAVKLFKANKIDFILVSGDNGRKDYNEPAMFKEDLINAGVPKEKIFLDYAGFRTLDSVVRAKEIFGQEQLTIISQAFHNERALFIANNKGIEAIGYNAKDVSLRYGFKVQIREVLARTKMMLDLFILNKSPKYLGEKIEIK